MTSTERVPREKKREKATTRHQSLDRDMRSARATLSLLLLFRLVQSFFCIGILCICQESPKKDASVVLHRRQPENVKGKSKNEQPCWNIWNRKRKFPGAGFVALKPARHRRTVLPRRQRQREGGEAPPTLGKAPDLDRISRFFLSHLTKLPIRTAPRSPKKGGEGEEETQVLGGH